MVAFSVRQSKSIVRAMNMWDELPTAGTVQLVSNARINHSVQRAANRPSHLTDRDREGWCSTEATPGTGETGGDVEIRIKYRDKKVPQETHTLDPPRGIPVCNHLPVPSLGAPLS